MNFWSAGGGFYFLSAAVVNRPLRYVRSPMKKKGSLDEEGGSCNFRPAPVHEQLFDCSQPPQARRHDRLYRNEGARTVPVLWGRLPKWPRWPPALQPFGLEWPNRLAPDLVADPSMHLRDVRADEHPPPSSPEKSCGVSRAQVRCDCTSAARPDSILLGATGSAKNPASSAPALSTRAADGPSERMLESAPRRIVCGHTPSGRRRRGL